MSRNPCIRLPADFRRLVWSNLAAQSAEQVGLAAAPIIAVLALGAREGAAGFLQTAQTLPFLLFSIPAGVLADRKSRARLMAGAEALRAISLLAVLGLMIAGALNLPLLAVLGFIGACGIGGGSAFGVAAALSAVAVVLLVGVQAPRHRQPSSQHPLREVREGARFVLRHALLRPISDAVLRSEALGSVRVRSEGHGGSVRQVQTAHRLTAHAASAHLHAPTPVHCRSMRFGEASVAGPPSGRRPCARVGRAIRP